MAIKSTLGNGSEVNFLKRANRTEKEEEEEKSVHTTANTTTEQVGK